MSIDVYRHLESLEQDSYIIKNPNQRSDWADYYLTQNGRQQLKEIIKEDEIKDYFSDLEQIVNEIKDLNFRELLQKVYKEAPEYAESSLLRGAL